MWHVCERGTYEVLTEKPEEKSPFGRPRPRRDGNKKTDCRKLDRDMVWIDLAQDRDMWWALVNAVMKLQFPHNVRNFLTS